MPKPFGKPGHHGRTLTKGLRLTFALWGAAIPAYLLCRHAEKSVPTLAENAFFAPISLGFVLFYAISLATWFHRRPVPRPPGGSTTGRFVGFFILALFIAFPAGFVSGLLYEPAFKLANARGSMGGPVVEHALVQKVGTDWYLDCPYWADDFRWKIPDPASLPKDVTAGSLATITIRTGLLGARYIQSIEYTVLE